MLIRYWSETKVLDQYLINIVVFAIWVVMPLLQIEINWTIIEIEAWVNDYILTTEWGVITHPCPNIS